MNSYDAVFYNCRSGICKHFSELIVELQTIVKNLLIQPNQHYRQMFRSLFYYLNTSLVDNRFQQLAKHTYRSPLFFNLINSNVKIKKDELIKAQMLLSVDIDKAFEWKVFKIPPKLSRKFFQITNQKPSKTPKLRGFLNSVSCLPESVFSVDGCHVLSCSKKYMNFELFLNIKIFSNESSFIRLSNFTYYLKPLLSSAKML